MADRADAGARETFLVEHYRPGRSVDELRGWALRVRVAALRLEREGRPVRYLRSAIVPADEALLCVLEAADEGVVRETYARAGIPFERLSALIAEGDAAWAATDEGREE
ncbi:MAG TPA: nickel-binding protein [Gaiellaceae bacterium]|nr:nickel-binding protein [Gaiellaceae bacterium]